MAEWVDKLSQFCAVKIYFGTKCIYRMYVLHFIRNGEEK